MKTQKMKQKLEELKRAYSNINNISIENANKLGDILDKLPTEGLKMIYEDKIPMLWKLALNRLIRRDAI